MSRPPATPLTTPPTSPHRPWIFYIYSHGIHLHSGTRRSWLCIYDGLVLQGRGGGKKECGRWGLQMQPDGYGTLPQQSQYVILLLQLNLHCTVYSNSASDRMLRLQGSEGKLLSVYVCRVLNGGLWLDDFLLQSLGWNTWSKGFLYMECKTLIGCYLCKAFNAC